MVGLVDSLKVEGVTEVNTSTREVEYVTDSLTFLLSFNSPTLLVSITETAFLIAGDQVLGTDVTTGLTDVLRPVVPSINSRFLGGSLSVLFTFSSINHTPLLSLAIIEVLLIVFKLSSINCLVGVLGVRLGTA